tara:strand:+ start:174 stop:623 length:450 start_codon:yes stop_codon:yes gene_type:complete
MKKTSKYEKIAAVLDRFPKKSNKEIAARVGVSASYVYKVKSACGDVTTGNNNVAVGHVAPSAALRWEDTKKDLTASDGSTASYYELPEEARELQDLISHRNMNAQIGEIFRSCYRYGLALHSDQLRDAKKIKFYIDAEIKRLEKGNFLN